MSYRVDLSRPARKALADLPAQSRARITIALEHLASDPFPPGTKTLHGKVTDLHRLRVGDYRAIYSVDTQALLVRVVRIARRSESTYRGL